MSTATCRFVLGVILAEIDEHRRRRTTIHTVLYVFPKLAIDVFSIGLSDELHCPRKSPVEEMFLHFDDHCLDDDVHSAAMSTTTDGRKGQRGQPLSDGILHDNGDQIGERSSKDVRIMIGFPFDHEDTLAS